MKYEFEKCLERNEMSVSVVDARRFGRAIRDAMRMLKLEASCYRLTKELYYLEVQAFLEQMAVRLEAPFRKEE